MDSLKPHVLSGTSTKHKFVILGPEHGITTVESEMDAILTHWDAGDLADVIDSGSAQMRPERDSVTIFIRPKRSRCPSTAKPPVTNKSWQPLPSP